MTDQELIRIALSYLSANINEAEEAMDIVIDTQRVQELEEEHYRGDE